MKELKNAKFRPPSPVADSAGLSALTGFLNQVSGSVVPKEPPVAGAVKVAPIVVSGPTPQNQAPPQASAAAPALNLNRVFVTGRMKVGKDYCLAQAGFKIHALSDPLYFLVDYFFGKQDKDVSRIFLQTIGQWGRGTVSAAYPLTPERAVFVRSIRAITESALAVDWASYGQHEGLWLDALVARVKAEPAGARVAVSGVRFSNEHERLTKEGFVGFHCICSPATWAARLKQVGLAPDSPACRDVSEALAASLDASVTKTLSQQLQGNKLRAVWSDSNVPAPSQRLLSVQEFVNLFPKI